MTLCHILHYAFLQKFIIVHVKWGMIKLIINNIHILLTLQLLTSCYCSGYHWFNDMKEVANSALSPGYMDLPIDAGLWLKQFKDQNINLLTQLDVCVL